MSKSYAMSFAGIALFWLTEVEDCRGGSIKEYTCKYTTFVMIEKKNCLSSLKGFFLLKLRQRFTFI